MESIRNYGYLNLDDNGHLTFMCENEVKDLGDINKGLYSPARMINELSVNRLKLMGFTNITDEDIHPYRDGYKNARDKVRKLRQLK